MGLRRRIGALQAPRWNPHALSLAVLVVVVLALATLQYRWIDQVSDAQTTRATSRLRENVIRVTDALDAEITRAVLAFTLPPAVGESMHGQLERAWPTWNNDAPWPRIVSAIWYLDADDNGWHSRSWGAAGTVDPRSILPADDVVPGRGGRDAVHLEVQGRALFVDERPCMLWPLPPPSTPPESPRLDRVLVCYDLRYLTDTFLPRLLEKYLSVEDRGDFVFHLEPRGRASSSGAVITASQFHYRPDCLVPGARGEPALSVSGFRKTPAGVPPRSVELAPRLVGGHNTSLASILHAEGACKAGAPVDSGLIQISVRRPPGTLTDLFTGFRRRNILVSGLVMMALLAALIALVVSTERARRLARLQTVIAAGISHELRSPLASLNVAADHLKNGHVETPEQARRYGEIIDAQSKRLRHVVDQALALTTLSQSSGADGHAVSVSEIIHAVCDALAPQARQAGIEIQSRVASDVPLASVHPDVLLRCLTNLIENSIKYAASGRWIHVSAQRAGYAERPTVEVAVEDRGPGIEENETATVFEPFFRGSSARRSRQSGSGLGLSIVKTAVEACGGGIEVERTTPHGCRFRLFFLTAPDVAGTHSAGSEVQLHAVASHTPDRR